MPRITGGDRGRALAARAASMRPGRNAPDNPVGEVGAERRGGASMRPGRNAPDNESLHGNAARTARLQ